MHLDKPSDIACSQHRQFKRIEWTREMLQMDSRLYAVCTCQRTLPRHVVFVATTALQTALDFSDL